MGASASAPVWELIMPGWSRIDLTGEARAGRFDLESAMGLVSSPSGTGLPIPDRSAPGACRAYSESKAFLLS